MNQPSSDASALPVPRPVEDFPALGSSRSHGDANPATGGTLDSQDQPFSARPLQFSLRTLMLAMMLASLLFGSATLLGPIASVIAGWFLLLILFHVAANVWGSRLPSALDHRPRKQHPLESPGQVFSGARQD